MKTSRTQRHYFVQQKLDGCWNCKNCSTAYSHDLKMFKCPFEEFCYTDELGMCNEYHCNEDEK